jgi:hypothetical protein
MAETKGVLLSAWRQLLSERFGEKAVTQAIASLPPEDRILLSPLFLPSSWYPFETLHSLRRLTRAVMADEPIDLTDSIGRFMAERACLGVYRTLLASDPAKEITKLTLVEELLFRPSRRIEVEPQGDSSVVMRYHYGDDVKLYRSICGSHVGFVSRMFELSGAKDVKGRHTKCVAKGADCCEFVYTWR